MASLPKAATNKRGRKGQQVPAETKYAACVLHLFHRMSSPDVATIIGVAPSTIRAWAASLSPEQRETIESHGTEYIRELKETLKTQLVMQLTELHKRTIEGAHMLADRIIERLQGNTFSAKELVDLAKNMPISVGVYVDKFITSGGWADKTRDVQMARVDVNVQFAGQAVSTPERVPRLQTVEVKALPPPEEPESCEQS